jgi:hypothetical protein
MTSPERGVSEDRRVEFGVGIHVGDDVEESDGNLIGDGVYIAARLEGVGEPGGVRLSGAAYEYVRDRLKEPFVDLGEKTKEHSACPCVRCDVGPRDRKARTTQRRNASQAFATGEALSPCCRFRT